jgi:hypothetical protein
MDNAPIADAGISFDHGDLSPSEAATLAQWQAEDGTAPVSEEVVEPALPPAQGHEFDIGPLRDDGLPYTPEDQEADTSIRSWMVEAGLPKGTGNFVIAEAKTLAPKLMAMTDAERGIFQQQERVKLQAIWKDDFSKNLRSAREMVKQIEAKRPGIIDFMERSGLGDSSSVIVQLHHASMTRRK